MSGKEGCVIDRKVEDTKWQGSLRFRPLACQQGQCGCGQPGQIPPGCHALEMRLERATATRIACTRWALGGGSGTRT